MMESIKIIPFISAGLFKLGMTRDEARHVGGGNFRSFSRTPSAYPCDYYEDMGLFCMYDDSGKLEAVEMCFPCKVDILGKNILELNFQKAIELLSLLDSDLEIEIDGALAHKVGISIYAPLAKEDPNAKIETVLAFKEGYYD